MGSNMRLIDADALTETIGIRLYSGAVMEFVSVEDIAKQPTVDAVPVIRCKDCAFYLTGYNQTRYCAKDGILKRETYYCAGAERKE